MYVGAVGAVWRARLWNGGGGGHASPEAAAVAVDRVDSDLNIHRAAAGAGAVQSKDQGSELVVCVADRPELSTFTYDADTRGGERALVHDNVESATAS